MKKVTCMEVVEVRQGKSKRKCGKSAGKVNEETFTKSNTDRSSQRRCSVKKGVLKNFADFTRKYLCWSLFLIKF